MQNRYEKRILRVVNHIHDNLDRDLSLDALAEVALKRALCLHPVGL